MTYKITIISDTHGKHKQITSDLPGGDILIHAGDISSIGYKHEIQQFCKWFNDINNYDNKVFIAGNHDWGFQDNVDKVQEILNSYKTIDYLQDNYLQFGTDMDNLIKIHGSPWQPEFYNWAFNLPRNSTELLEKWNMIPDDTDILITHGPAWGYLDQVIGKSEHLGCELLTQRIKVVKPKIHVCGHIHSGHGYKFDGYTHFINASVLNEDYIYTYNPLTFNWIPDINEIEFL